MRGVWPSPQSLIVRFNVGLRDALRHLPDLLVRPFLHETAGRHLLAGAAFEEAGNGLTDALGRVRALRVDLALKGFVDEAGVDRVDDLLDQGRFGEALLVSTLAPVVLDVAVMPSDR